MAKAFDQKVDNDGLLELTQAILGHVHRLPGNERCADCDSEKGMSPHGHIAVYCLFS